MTSGVSAPNVKVVRKGLGADWPASCQTGTPAEILADPANEFVATFIGADRGKRALSIRNTGGRDLLVDADGRPAGVLVEAATE